MSGTVNDRILRTLIQLCKICHISGNTDHQSLVVFRMYLRVQQCLGVYNIDLNMLTTVFKIGFDHTLDEPTPKS